MRTVNAAKVVAGEMQSERGPMAIPLLREAVGQACQSAHLHRHAEILALHDGRAKALRIRITKALGPPPPSHSPMIYSAAPSSAREFVEQLDGARCGL
jgi:hypothetical protein